MSAHITLCPKSEIAAPLTNPTYPVPIKVIFSIYLPLFSINDFGLHKTILSSETILKLRQNYYKNNNRLRVKLFYSERFLYLIFY